MTRSAFQVLVAGARVLEERHGRAKVLLLPDGDIVKLFNMRPRPSGALIYPYSLRFRRNARQLSKRGILSVEVRHVFFCPSERAHGVIYPLLPGRTLLEMLAEDPEPSRYAARVGSFVADLHARGIYFRALHPGNILVTSDGRLALIDVGDVRFRSGALRDGLRVRNFRHLVRRRAHAEQMVRMGPDAFVSAYLDAAGISGARRRRLERRLFPSSAENEMDSRSTPS
jgi:tRNA A-37 threonylcarbamoyl transferase component Bud32